jgi:hypothetical protein
MGSSWRRRMLVPLLGLATLGIAAPAIPASATTGTGSTQTVAFTTVGVLAVSVANVAPNLSNLGSGLTAANQALGTMTVMDTLASGNPWTASVAASDCVTVPAGGVTIPAANLTFNPGATFVPSGPSAGTSATFANPSPDTTPGTTLSPAVAVATDNRTTSNANNGTFVQSGNTLSVHVPDNATLGAYTCTLQYTITG